MITYHGVEKRYQYDKETLKALVDKMQEEHFNEFSSQEDIYGLISEAESFLDTVHLVEVEKTMERHETEEEAREYFGPEFVQEWNDLIKELDKQDTIVSLHGTPNGNGDSICETGLKYKNSSLSATAVGQPMPLGDESYDYPSFESLLNWGHHGHKCLVIIAVPYECYYKEGLWKVGEAGGSGYDYNHLITPDFIVGYIDVETKRIIRNPKYNRNHDYSGKEPDMELYREDPEMDNGKIRESLIEERQKDDFEIPQTSAHQEETFTDAKEVGYTTDELLVHLNTLLVSSMDYIKEEDKESKLDLLVYLIEKLKRLLPLLKTKEELEQLASNDVFGSVFDGTPSAPTAPTEDVWDASGFDFGAEPDWGFSGDEPKGLH